MIRWACVVQALREDVCITWEAVTRDAYHSLDRRYPYIFLFWGEARSWLGIAATKGVSVVCKIQGVRSQHQIMRYGCSTGLVECGFNTRSWSVVSTLDRGVWFQHQIVECGFSTRSQSVVSALDCRVWFQHKVVEYSPHKNSQYGPVLEDLVQFQHWSVWCGFSARREVW